MVSRRLAQSGLAVSPIGFGAFKIGRNTGTKYAGAYDLPTERESVAILHGALDLGINYIDTAPAYGLSEERVGRAVANVPNVVISTKVGETFEGGQSRYDFSPDAVRRSVEGSAARLQRDPLDVVLIHAGSDDREFTEGSGAVKTLQALRRGGRIRAIGLSARTPAGARAALRWADVIMVEYHLDERRFAPVIAEADAAGVGVVVKKGLASGRLDPEASIRFVLGTPGIASLVVGSLNLDHLRDNVAAAENMP